MADRVHPRNSSSPPSGAHVIHVPKDQVHPVPLPENARRWRCCCCLCWFIFIAVILIVLLAIASAVLYLIFRPMAPNYAIQRVAVKGMNISLISPSPSEALSPEFDVTVRADNDNDKIGIYYEKDSSVEMFFNDARLCNGALPAFYQPSTNVTMFETVLTGSDVELTVLDQKALVKAVAKRSVPLSLKMRAPVRVKVGSVKTWKITVKVDCDVTVDQLSAQARIVNKDCSHGLDLW